MMGFRERHRIYGATDIRAVTNTRYTNEAAPTREIRQYTILAFRNNCCRTVSGRTHRCCHLPNKVENIDRTPNILYTLQWVGRCPSPSCPFLWEGSRSYTNNIWLVPSESIPQTIVRSFSRFVELTAVTQNTHDICSNRPHLALLEALRSSLIITAFNGITFQYENYQ